MQPDDITRKVFQCVASGIATWNRHGVNSGTPSGLGQPEKLSDYKLVMSKKTLIAVIV
jgi:hypothetical protein